MRPCFLSDLATHILLPAKKTTRSIDSKLYLSSSVWCHSEPYTDNNMTAASISTCPVEVILRIIEFADRFSTAAALFRTSQHFCDVWTFNITSISIKTLPRLVKCSNDALILVAEQGYAGLKGVRQAEQQNNKYIYTVRQLRRFGDNERTMLVARHAYEKNIRDNVGRYIAPMYPVRWYCSSLYGARYTLFVQAYYRI